MHKSLKDKAEKMLLTKWLRYNELEDRENNLSPSELKEFYELKHYYEYNKDKEFKAISVKQGDVDDGHGKGLFHRCKLMQDKMYHRQLREEDKKEIRDF
jgi:hypothetical protein